MIKRTVRGAIQILAGLGAGLAIMIVLAAWLLSSGPLSLAFLTPYIEDGLNRFHPSIDFRLDDTILTWAGWERTLDIRVVNVRATGPDGNELAAIPELSISLSAKALARGVVAPKKIEMFGPRISVVRGFDGRFQVGFAGTGKGTEKMVSGILDQLLKPGDAATPMTFLSQVHIVDAAVSFEDQVLGLKWDAPASTIQLEREDGGVRGDVTMRIDTEGLRSDVTVQGTYRSTGQRLDLGVGFSEITPSAFAGLSDALKPLQSIDFPVQGTATISMTAAGAIEGVGFDLTGGRGKIDLPQPMAQTLAVQSMAVQGRFEGLDSSVFIDSLKIDLGRDGTFVLPGSAGGNDPAHRLPLKSLSARGQYSGLTQILEVSSLDADLYGPQVSMTAKVMGIAAQSSPSPSTSAPAPAPAPDSTIPDAKEGSAKIVPPPPPFQMVAAELRARDIPISDISRYWPRAWGTDAREWISKGITEGNIRDITANTVINADGKGGYAVEALNGQMVINDASLDYLAPMPKAQDISASVRFDRKQLEVSIFQGKVAGLTSGQGRIVFTGLDAVDQYMDIDLVLDGKVKDAMRLIDHEPLKFASILGIAPDKAEGAASVRLKLRMILEHALTLDQIEASATASFKDAAVADVVFGMGLSKGDLTLEVDKKGMDLSGRASLGRIPSRFAWRQNFGDDVPFRSSYNFSGEMKNLRDMKDFGFDLAPFPNDFMRGNVGVGVRYVLKDDGKGSLDARLELRDSVLSIPVIEWTKDAGAPGVAETHIVMQDGKISEIPQFLLESGDMRVSGNARYSQETGKLQRIDFDRLAFGRTNVRGSLIELDGGGWHVTAYGKELDIAPIIDNLMASDEGTDGDGPLANTNVNLTTEINKVWLAETKSLTDVAGTFSLEDDLWKVIRLKGMAGKDKTFSLDLHPGSDGNRELTIRSADAGALFDAFDYYENMIGGQFELLGKYDDSKPNHPLTGKLLVRDYRIVKAPVLAHLLSILALTGIMDGLQGEGLGFSVLEAPFTLEGGVLDIKDARAAGLSLGVTASGKIYTHAEVAEIHGTIVPAYAINSFLGKIPILGPLLTGGEKGGGVFAATYSLIGPIEDPTISVNPLSAIAPGFMRNLFGIFGEQREVDPVPPGAPGADKPGATAPETPTPPN